MIKPKKTPPKRLFLTTIALGVFFAAALFTPAKAENYILSGNQDSSIAYELVQRVNPAANTRKLILSYVEPKSYASPTYNQNISELKIAFDPAPTGRKDFVDENNNKVIEVTWEGKLPPVKATITLKAKNSVKLADLKTQTPFPMPDLPEKSRRYLKATQQVPSENPEIRKQAQTLTRNANTEFDAVQQILSWVIDHMHYVLTPESYEAMYAFKTGKGNCQNYSHLAAALMRAVGIPTRIVNGVTLKKPYEISDSNKILTMKMAEGRHSWIEVYFPDLDWVPFDPQGTELYVSNRFIRIEVGLDNNDTEQDGLLRWTQPKGTTGRPQLEEQIKAHFIKDQVSLTAQKMSYGPQAMLLSPDVKAKFEKNPIAHETPPPPVAPEALDKITFGKPYTLGNLEFPANLDFLSARGPASTNADGTMQISKSFLVETAEYVTTKGRQYAQVFVVDKPLQLKQIGLALHKFNNQGQLWIELRKDVQNRPGDPLSISDIIDLEQLPYNPGYSWVDFTFDDAKIVLPPGRYWIALGFTAGPIVNWFFSYGKPVGPQDGTRYRTLFDENWRHSLNVEFNYRVQGLIANPTDNLAKQ